MSFITLRRNSYSWLLAAIIFAAGIIRVPVDNYRLLFTALFMVSATAVVAVMLFRVNPWVASFLMLAQVSMYYPSYTTHSHLAFQVVFYGATLYAVLVLLAPSERPVLDAICVIALVNVAVLLFQVLGVSPTDGSYSVIFLGGKNHAPVGLMDNQNSLSALLSFCLPAFFRRAWWWLLPAVILGLIGAQSFGGVLAAAAVTVFYVSRKLGNWKAPVFACMGGVILYAVFVDPPSVSVRGGFWAGIITMVPEHWVFGRGIGHFKVYAPVTSAGRWLYAHNEVLQAVFELGVGALVFIIGYLTRFFRKCRGSSLIAQSGLIAVFTNSLVNFPLHLGVTALIAIVWASIVDYTAVSQN